MFTLDERLAADTVEVGDLGLCRVLLMNDANYPWVILVPRRTNIREIHELEARDQQQLMRESASVSRAMMELFSADKMNVAALGNMVPQLHMHHIARYKNDLAWPKPVWGVTPAKPYAQEQLQDSVNLLRDRLLSGKVAS